MFFHGEFLPPTCSGKGDLEGLPPPDPPRRKGGLPVGGAITDVIWGVWGSGEKQTYKWHVERYSDHHGPPLVSHRDMSQVIDFVLFCFLNRGAHFGHIVCLWRVGGASQTGPPEDCQWSESYPFLPQTKNHGSLQWRALRGAVRQAPVRRIPTV